MISKSLIRQQSALLARIPLSVRHRGSNTPETFIANTETQQKCLFAPRTQVRYRHHTPALTHGHIFAKDGVNKMMSPDGFDLAWTQYQEYLVTELNAMTYGTVNSRYRKRLA